MSLFRRKKPEAMSVFRDVQYMDTENRQFQFVINSKIFQLILLLKTEAVLCLYLQFFKQEPPQLWWSVLHSSFETQLDG